MAYLTRDDGNLGDGGLSVGVQKLGAVPDDASVLLTGACKKQLWHVILVPLVASVHINLIENHKPLKSRSPALG